MMLEQLLHHMRERPAVIVPALAAAAAEMPLDRLAAIAARHRTGGNRGRQGGRCDGFGDGGQRASPRNGGLPRMEEMPPRFKIAAAFEVKLSTGCA
jgi:hypothetical protein